MAGLESCSEVPVDDGCKDVLHGLLVERVDADDIKVAQEAVGHVVPASSRGRHGGHHDQVLQVQDGRVLPEGREGGGFNVYKQIGTLLGLSY